MAFILQSEAHLPKMNGLHINGQDSLVQPLLMDLYQLNMCYGYWRAGTFDDDACFDLFFRKNPFKGEFTVFVGLEDCLRLVQNFHFSASDMDFIREVLPNAEPEFYEFLENLTCRKLKIFAIPEGTVVFPNMPLITLEGPLALCQLLETVLLNLVNYSSLVATNAARFRQVSGERVELLEFGLRRAQGPNGGLSASKYCYVGGFDSTSNLLAGKLFGIPVKGTQAHSFISSFSAESDLHARTLTAKDGARSVDLVELSQRKLRTLMDQLDRKTLIEWGISQAELSVGELVAFCAYAIAFPTGFLALIDTYDVLRSGVINFCAVTLAMHDLGYRAVGCRIDSGDLSYLSKEIRSRFKKIAALDYRNLSWIENLTIVASNDINEETIVSLNDQQHEINAFGVGTHLVTCQKQPALGCVYKLVTKSGLPKIKISQDVVKITIPGRKRCYRLYGKAGFAILDLMTLDDEPAPAVNTEILCRHPFEESKRAKVIPAKVEQLQLEFWDGEDIRQTLPSLREMRNRVHQSIGDLRSDHKRIVNPTPYKVSVSERLYHFLHTIWLQNAPIGQLE
ncbi:Nicotinate phosphoribosyltransferase domain containing protein [Aphelenchoides besseyi]|nr:Nicotinate phosphoribosyltransferase domain containing protein [Aphelenchoides besseyi]